MATASRHPSLDKLSQMGAPRHANGTAIQGTQLSSTQQQQQQQQNYHQQASRAHSHQPSSENKPALLNTELRAQARRERELSKEKSREILQGGHTGRERSSSILSNHQQGGEKKISPKGTAKTTIGSHAPRPAMSRHAHKSSTGVPMTQDHTSQKTLSRPPLQQPHTVSLDRRGFEDINPQMPPFSNLLSQIPSPPKGEETREFEAMQQTYIVKYYYDMVEKCHSWQRYASNLKAKAETLELENRILKDISEKQDLDIRSLEMEVSALKRQQQQSSSSGHNSEEGEGNIRREESFVQQFNLPGYSEVAVDTSRIGRSRAANYLASMSASNTFPPADNAPSAALIVQALAAMNRQGEEHSLQASHSVPLLPSQTWDQETSLSSPGRVAKRQASVGEGGLAMTTKRQVSQDFDQTFNREERGEGLVKHLNLPGYYDESANTSRTSRSSSRGASSAEEGEENQGQTMARGGSAHSDAATVTGDYLQDTGEQRRQLRKVSQSQQQQLHYLQARIHLNSNASQTSAVSARGSSRPSSRLSNYGVRGKTRSRAGSYTLHDSIPVEKDDVFGSSDALPMAPIKRAGTMPLSSIDVNSQNGQTSIVDWISSEASFADTSGQQPVKRELKPSQVEIPLESTILIDSDPKGAHRRLYIRLRDELETSDLVRFERYVHRYDALEIGVEGSRGIVNRVRRLLLPEELVHSKLAFPDKYRLRKELAREFERIVREDALPKEGTDDSQEAITSNSDVGEK